MRRLSKFRNEIAVRHRKIIIQRSLYWWRRLPPAVRCWYDLDDMVAEVQLYVVSNSHRYDPARGKDVTFCWHLADNCCRKILLRYQTQSRGIKVVRLDDGTVEYHSMSVPLDEDLTRVLADSAGNPMELEQSKLALQDLMIDASSRALDLLAGFLCGCLPAKLPQDAVRDLCKAAAGRCTAEDFRRVRQCVEVK